MEMLRVKMLVDGEHKLGGKDFVLGKIVGITEMICKKFNDKHNAMFDYGFGHVLTLHCTPEEYVELKTTIDNKYPGLCKFGIKVIVK